MVWFIQTMFRITLVINILFCASSCVKYYELSPSEFSQGTETKESLPIVRPYLKTLSLYNQFTTEGIFDALWLSDIVRAEYIQSYSSRRGTSVEKQEVMLRRQLEETKHWISFYLLADVRQKININLHEKHSCWSVYLCFDDNKKIEPVSIKEVEMEPEIQTFFGSRFNTFKTAYLVKFPAKSLDGKRYPVMFNSFKFIIASPEREGSISWPSQKTAANKEYIDEDYYWC